LFTNWLWRPIWIEDDNVLFRKVHAPALSAGKPGSMGSFRNKACHEIAPMRGRAVTSAAAGISVATAKPSLAAPPVNPSVQPCKTSICSFSAIARLSSAVE
jgi:hypothetical protein